MNFPIFTVARRKHDLEIALSLDIMHLLLNLFDLRIK